MDIAAVRQALADAVAAALPDVVCLGYVPDAVTEPCFYAGEVQISFDQAFNRGMDEVFVTCRILVSRNEDAAGQAELDGYLAGSGATSVKAAIEAARGAPGQAALSGACDDVHVTSVRGYRMYQAAGEEYYGAEIIVRVIGEGD